VLRAIDGLEVFNRMRKMSACASVYPQCIFVTGNSSARGYKARHAAYGMSVTQAIYFT